MRTVTHRDTVMVIESTLLELIDMMRFAFGGSVLLIFIGLLTQAYIVFYIGVALGIYGTLTVLFGGKKVKVDKENQVLTVENRFPFIFYASTQKIPLQDVNGVYVEFQKGEKSVGRQGYPDTWELMLHIKTEAYSNQRFSIERTTNQAQVNLVAERLGEFIGKSTALSTDKHKRSLFKDLLP